MWTHLAVVGTGIMWVNLQCQLGSLATLVSCRGALTSPHYDGSLADGPCVGAPGGGRCKRPRQEGRRQQRQSGGPERNRRRRRPGIGQRGWMLERRDGRGPTGRENKVRQICAAACGSADNDAKNASRSTRVLASTAGSCSSIVKSGKNLIKILCN